MKTSYRPPIIEGHPDYIPPGENQDCPSTLEFGRYECTLDKGHAGVHAAHGAQQNRLLVTWGDAEEDNR